MISLRLVVLGLLLIVATGSADAVEPYGSTFGLRIGDAVEVGPDGLMVGFDSIVYDSRCPLQVACVWGGNAESKLWFQRPGGDVRSFALHTYGYLEFPKAVVVDGFEFALVDLKPYPVQPGPIVQSRYVLSMTVVEVGFLPVEASTWGQLKALY